MRSSSAEQARARGRQALVLQKQRRWSEVVNHSSTTAAGLAVLQSAAARLESVRQLLLI